ncbi:MAG: divalent metal cation transporter [Rhodothermales bacterium]|nr:divalent metal cation transporter [Rhodothermales bacterium]MBO6778588.1 divalent metal cation transporter [Rhodothermales bacterium]
MKTRLGTSSLVVAAFVGPGTVLTCASAGVRFDYALGWVLVFASLAVFVLQSFTAASGILAGKGLGDALRDLATRPIARGAVNVLVVLGLWVGCAAFETGNLLGAAAGFEAALGLPSSVAVVLCAVAALVLLLFNLKAVTTILAGLVAVMSVVFLTSAMLADIDWGAFVRGLAVPTVPDGSIVTVIALMGTTVVTYNLFLHASASRRYWAADETERAWRGELRGMALFIPLGGLVSLCILATGAAVSEGGMPASIGEFAVLLEPAAGAASRYLFAAGLLAAGLTSAVTAPLAAAAGISELFAWDADGPRFRIIWASVLATGVFFALTGVSPLQLIIAAQAANGVLLPLIAGLVVFVAVRQRATRLPGWYLGLGGVIVLVCAGLGVRTLMWVWGQLA